MSFKPHQQKSKLENVSKFIERIRSILEEAKSTIQKSQNDIARYYNQYYTSGPIFQSSNKVFLNASDIYITQLSAKLLYYYLRSYMVEKWVELMLYCLKLSLVLCKLHLVFYIIILTPIPENLILEKYSKHFLDSIIINREEEWEVEKILNSY